MIFPATFVRTHDLLRKCYQILRKNGNSRIFQKVPVKSFVKMPGAIKLDICKTGLTNPPLFAALRDQPYLTPFTHCTGFAGSTRFNPSNRIKKFAFFQLQIFFLSFFLLLHIYRSFHMQQNM